MPTTGKRLRAMREKMEVHEGLRTVDQALTLIKESASAKFNESVDVVINLGVDSRKSDQGVRGATLLPNGTGKTVRIALFAEGADADKGREAGADIVGFEDLAADIKQGKMDFDVVIATPASMRVVGQLGQILGPRGLMPNPKVGTVTAEVETAVKNAKAGQVQFRTDKAGIIHCSIGKASFSVEHLRENLVALVNEVVKAKPSSSKGMYLRTMSVSSTMGLGVAFDKSSLDV